MENQNLIDQLKALERTIERVNSLKFVFFRGIIMGVGTFIGASIVAAVVIAILTQAIDLLGLRSFVESVIR